MQSRLYKMKIICIFFYKIFAYIKKKQYLCTVKFKNNIINN